MSKMRKAGLAVLVLAVSASSAIAQGKGQWEFGTDFVGFNSNSPDGGTSSSSINLGASNAIRVGKMITDKISVEPLVTFISNSGGGSTFTGTSFSVAALWHLKAMSNDAPGWFVRPAVGLTSSKFTGSPSVSRTNMGVGIGMKKKMKNILIVRAEGYFSLTPKKDTAPSETDVGVRAGLSVVTGGPM